MTRLLVRLPNWIGDTVMTLPGLAALAGAGFELHLLGKGWARSLLGGLPYTVHAYPAGFGQRVALLRQLATSGPGVSGKPAPILLMTNSLSSALEARMAGVPATGYRHEGRGLLLSHALAQDLSLHQVERYWLLAQSMARLAPRPEALDTPAPRHMELRLTAEAQAAARERVSGLGQPFILLCPFGAGTIKGQSKLWNGFAGLIVKVHEDPRTAGLNWVVCPGKGEVLDPALQALLDKQKSGPVAGSPLLHVFENVGLPEYAALMKLAVCTVGNDSGPSHMAAAVGATQLTIFGPSDPADTAPWHPLAVYLGGRGQWPGVEDVQARLLATITRS